MNELSFLGSSEPENIEKLYKLYRNDPETIDDSWKRFFEGFEFAQKSYPDSGESQQLHIDKEFKVLNLIDNYRRRGHLFTETNPVRKRRKYTPTLDIENSGLTNDDLDMVFQAGKEVGIGPASLREIVAFLQETYCRSIGTEYMFLRNFAKIGWIRDRIETTRNHTAFVAGEKRRIFNLLTRAVVFEQFIHKKFVGQKRFSLEGTETLIPALHYLIEAGSDLGISEFTIGMAHRGRLNVLGNIIKKPFENIFQEFNADAYDDSVALGDVKYHLGYGNRYTLENGNTIDLNLTSGSSVLLLTHIKKLL